MNYKEKKITIAVITLQAVNNYGSFLQALATQELFESTGYYRVIFYDYYPDTSRFIGLIKLWSNWNPIKVIAILPTIGRWYFVFRRTREKMLNLTKQKYYVFDDFVKKPVRCDALCVGSDQVWNSIWNKGIVPELYLQFANEGQYTFTFASSFGVEEIKQDEVCITKPWLKHFNRLSVREASANRILRDYYDIYNGEVLMDPTLLVPAQKWRELEGKFNYKSKYILIYKLFRNKEFEAYARTLSEKTGLKLVRLCFRYDQFYKRGKCILIPSVKKFLALIDNAEYVLTDSFHGTAFSIIFNTYPICFLPPVFTTRIRDFLRRIGAENRIVKSSDDYSVLEHNLSFAEINKKLEDEREKCSVYLEKIYNDVMYHDNKENDGE